MFEVWQNSAPFGGRPIDGAFCENIICGYLYDGDLVFVILKGISVFKFPERFLEISSRNLTSSFLFQLI
jgi:hypothetical protein